jgi:hypothetical protein
MEKERKSQEKHAAATREREQRSQEANDQLWFFR